MSLINLLPEDYLQRRSQHRANVICMALFGIVMASICGAALVSERTSSNTRQVCQQINRSYADAAKLIDQMQVLESQKRRMLQKAETSAALMERLPRSFLLAMVTNALPEGASLTNLKMEVKAVQPDAESKAKPKTKAEKVAAERDRPASQPAALASALTMVIDGVADTDVEVARFIANLAKNPLTELVDLAFSQETKTKDTVFRKFQLMVRLKGQADALDGLPTVLGTAAVAGPDGGQDKPADGADGGKP